MKTFRDPCLSHFENSLMEDLWSLSSSSSSSLAGWLQQSSWWSYESLFTNQGCRHRAVLEEMECCSDSPSLYGYFVVAKIEWTLAQWTGLEYFTISRAHKILKILNANYVLKSKLFEFPTADVQEHYWGRRKGSGETYWNWLLQFVGACQQNCLKCWIFLIAAGANVLGERRYAGVGRRSLPASILHIGHLS